jgi:hypothetical protein
MVTELLITGSVTLIVMATVKTRGVTLIVVAPVGLYIICMDAHTFVRLMMLPTLRGGGGKRSSLEVFFEAGLVIGSLSKNSIGGLH